MTRPVASRRVATRCDAMRRDAILRCSMSYHIASRRGGAISRASCLGRWRRVVAVHAERELGVAAVGLAVHDEYVPGVVDSTSPRLHSMLCLSCLTKFSRRRNEREAPLGVAAQSIRPISLLILSLLRFLDSNKNRRSLMDMRIPPLKTKIMPESGPLKSRILVWRLAVGAARLSAFLS